MNNREVSARKGTSVDAVVERDTKPLLSGYERKPRVALTLAVVGREL